MEAIRETNSIDAKDTIDECLLLNLKPTISGSLCEGGVIDFLHIDRTGTLVRVVDDADGGGAGVGVLEGKVLGRYVGIDPPFEADGVSGCAKC